MDLGLSGKVAMVAGASRGLGFAVARALAAEGALVSIASRDAGRIGEAQRRLEGEYGKNIFASAADVRSAGAIETWRDATLREFGGIDMVFVNSGGPPAGAFLAFDDAAWQEAFELLVLSAVRTARAVFPALRSRGGGSILFSVSSSVKEPIDNLALSNVVRASVPALSKTLAREFAADHIRCNTIIPGRFDTDRVRELDAINAGKKNITADEQKSVMAAAIPSGRYGDAGEFAQAAAFLLSPAAAYITGACLQVDGGMIKSVY
jgi:3-oxoacyl-[acyl-carrier protein] reductase